MLEFVAELMICTLLITAQVFIWYAMWQAWRDK